MKYIFTYVKFVASVKQIFPSNYYMFNDSEDFLGAIDAVETAENLVFPLCGLCDEPLLDGELTAHRDCHRSEHIRAYLQDEEVFS